MQRLDEFRLFYNHTIHPELVRLERKRKRLLLLLLFTFLFIFALVALATYFKIPTVTFFLMIPFGFYITYLLYRIRQFVATFKPHVVNLILDFIDDGLNFGTLKYDSEKFISKKEFHASQIFASRADYYLGEDYINGKIGELDFEMCELKVRERSKVRNRLNYVFRGIFMKATFKKEMRGSILMLPREFKQYLTRSIKAFSARGGDEVELTYHDEEFKEIFMTYATEDAEAESVLSLGMQEAIVEYREKTEKEIYLSIINKDIYIGVTEPKDILEPHIFTSNISFELVRQFFEDIQLLVTIVQDFDENH